MVAAGRSLAPEAPPATDEGAERLPIYTHANGCNCCIVIVMHMDLIVIDIVRFLVEVCSKRG